ncbi:hypothetical protein C5167_048379 [Papaver somniferum]|uniref:UBX domain-containing protein n=1 Tax=Papaver somniferum TaxID=3469 RepID=A0A4Y7KHT6_PAPSO|nr:plant UBX domain-containing protein 8-like [Papaver somniferum]RZC72903.1 hypothetical protein C5167_048379 [Papaver somniferum]
MARPNEEAIETFMSITGASQEVALQKLEERGGDLNEAVNAYFSEGDRNSAHPASTAIRQNDFMDIDNDDPLLVEPQGPSLPLLSAARNLNPFSLLDPTFGHSFLEGRGFGVATGAPLVSHPREVREIPIEVKDGNDQSIPSGSRPVIEDITGTTTHGPEIHGRVIIDDDEDENIPTAPTAPVLDYDNDIEEEMIRAAIEASKREVEEGNLNHQSSVPSVLSGLDHQQREPPAEDAELLRAVSLSMKTAEREKALRGQGNAETTEKVVIDSSDEEEIETLAANRRRLRSFNQGASSQSKVEAGSSSVQDEAEDIEEQPLVRNRSRRVASRSVGSLREVGEMDESPPASPGPPLPQNGDTFPAEWGGISSEEHDEAVMLEAALFGGVPEGPAYNYPYPTRQTRNMGYYPQSAPRPPSPTLTAQRLLREQQDDEYLASLQADREKAEARLLEEQAARVAALEEERKKEQEAQQKLLEEEEFERTLAAKEASLPQEPATDDENAINLLIRMPDGSRRGRRFLKSDRLQSLFDFIDVGRAVKPGTYRLVRPYPRRAFSDGESAVSLTDLGLTGKQEALFLELI